MSSPSPEINAPQRTQRRKRGELISFLSILTFCISLCPSCPLWLPLSFAQPTTKPVLHVVADPNNLPFSNDKQEGFENKIAQLLARELGATVDFSWYAQRRGYIRNAVRHGDAEVVIGVPHDFDPLLTTKPYYRSTYVFVSRADRHLDVSSLDDPRLRTLKIGVQLIGDDGINTPPAHALGARGIVTNVAGYQVYADYRKPNPPARIVDAVVNGDVDLAIVWGPLAGYFAKAQPVPLTLTPVSPDHDGPFPLAFDISVGVKRGNKSLRDRIDHILKDKHNDIAKILADYNVPLAPQPHAAADTPQPGVAARLSQAKPTGP